MTDTLFDLPLIPGIPVKGEDRPYPVGRIFCVGRNYAAHAAEMGFEVDREAPFYFTKTPSAVVLSGAEVPYPPGTENFHYEMELVMAIGAPVFRATKEQANAAIYAYGCGLDMTRRDLQGQMKKMGRPWEIGKAFEHSAPVGPLVPASEIGHPSAGEVSLKVNGSLRQQGDLAQMIWKVPEMISYLSEFFELAAGDVILTGTPSGVGPVMRGDSPEASVEGLGEMKVQVV